MGKKGITRDTSKLSKGKSKKLTRDICREWRHGYSAEEIAEAFAVSIHVVNGRLGKLRYTMKQKNIQF